MPYCHACILVSLYFYFTLFCLVHEWKTCCFVVSIFAVFAYTLIRDMARYVSYDTQNVCRKKSFYSHSSLMLFAFLYSFQKIPMEMQTFATIFVVCFSLASFSVFFILFIFFRCMKHEPQRFFVCAFFIAYFYDVRHFFCIEWVVHIQTCIRCIHVDVLTKEKLNTQYAVSYMVHQGGAFFS